MIYAQKKVVKNSNSAKQTAQIIATVTALLDKKLIRIEENIIFLSLDLWKDKKTADNWIQCLVIFLRVKKNYTKGKLTFKNIENEQEVASYFDKKVKILIFN